MEAVILDAGSIDPGDLDLSALSDCVTHLQRYESTEPEDTLSRCKSANIAITNQVKLTESILQQCPTLELICTFSTGVNQVDLVATEKLGIPVCNIRDYGTDSVSQHVFALLLELSRHCSSYNRICQNGEWTISGYSCQFRFPIEDLTGKVLGIVGYGVLGKRVASIAQAFGMHVLIAERKNHPVRAGRMAFEAVLEQSDIISLHCPLTAETHHIIDQQALELMGAGSWLVNTARGGLIDQHALGEALDAGTIGAAALDVLYNEPPTVDEELLKQQHANLIVTPHVAWASRSARQNAISETAKNIVSFQNGIVRNQVI